MEHDFSLLQEDPQCERLVLSYCLLGEEANDSLTEIVNNLTVENFAIEKNRIIYQAILDLHEAGVHVDRISVAHRLIDNKKIDSVGGFAYISQLDDRLGTILGVTNYIQRLLELTLSRKMATLVAKAQKHVQLYGAEAEFLARFEKEFADLTLESTAAGKERLRKASVILDEMGGFKGLLEKRKVIVPTPFPHLNDLLGGGLREGDLMLLAARPSVGKTSIAGQFAQCASVQEEPLTTLYFPVETGPDPVIMKSICSQIGVPTHLISQPDCPAQIRARFIKEAHKVLNWPILYDVDNLSRFPDIARAIRHHKATKGRPHLVIIDYLQLLSMPGRFDNVNNELAAVCRSLKLLANEVGAAFLVLSQLSRPDKDSPDKKPTLSWIRNTGVAEEAADIIWFIHQDEDQKPRQRRVTWTYLAKQRNGPLGQLDMSFDSVQCKLGYLTPGYIQDADE